MTKLRLKTLLLAVLGMWMAGSVMAEEHYLVGGATDSGWNAGEYNRSAVAMVKVSGNEWIWCGKLTVNDGDDDAKRFKIPDGYDSWNGYWAPEQNMALPMNGTDFVNLSTNSNGDYKFKVQETGYYKVTIYTGENPKMTAKKLTDLNPTNGYYEINSLDAYYWFAAYIATEDTKASKARLTANLDFSGEGFFPLASDKHKFQGEFDGGGHKVSGINASGDYKAMGFFRYATGGAYIHDLVIEGSFTGTMKVGGVIGFIRDHQDQGSNEVTLTNIISNANVQATKTDGDNGDEGNAGGLVGSAVDGIIITATNCANMGTVSGQNGQCAAFAGWTQSRTKFTNCWNSGDIYNMENNCNLYRNTPAVTESNCWDANGADFYAQGKKLANATIASGELCYSLNGDQSTINWYQNLTGTVDAYPVPFSNNNRVYQNDHESNTTSTYSNVEGSHTWNEWGFCSVQDCNKFNTTWMTPVDGCYKIGNTEQLNWFAYYVNYENNKINGKLTADIDFTSQSAMIGMPGHPYGGEFNGQGHTVTVGYNVSADECALFRRVNGGTIKNLKVDGTITTSGKYAGGIVSGIWQTATIENCVANVTIKDSNSGDRTHGGIVARITDKSNITIRNCAFTGKIDASGAEGSGGILGWPDNASNNEVKIQNCLMAGTLILAQGKDNDVICRNSYTMTNCYATDLQSMNNSHNATRTTDDLVNKLGTHWYQGTSETLPRPIAYSTDKNLNDGAYDLANAKDLVWFASLVDCSNNPINARLTADIDFNNINDYPGIGTCTNRFNGIFDGQKHRISNLHMTIDEDAVGFFRYVTSGGTVIKRFTIDNTCSFSGNAGVGAFVGRAEGRNGDRDLTFEGLGNEANVTASGANGGGILGVDMNSDAVITINNCYNAGTITSGNEGGGISGWLGDNAVLTNVYNMGTVNGNNSDKFARGGNQNKTNCYDNEATYTDGTIFASLFAYNDNGVDGSVWRMYFDADDATKSHPVLYGDAIAMREDCQNRMVENGEYDVTMFRTVKAGGWNTVCLPFNMDATAISNYFGNGTKVAKIDETKSADGETIHFTTVETITAGQAYLVYPGVTDNFTQKSLGTVTIEATAPSTGLSQAGFTFQGVYDPTDLNSSTDRIVAGGNTIVKTSDGQLKGFRAFFRATGNNARATRFVIDDDVTGIITPEGEFIEDGPVYNLGGQRVNKPQHGLYIQNGKKVVIK